MLLTTSLVGTSQVFFVHSPTLDIGNGPQLITQFRQQLVAVPHVIVNLAGVQVCDSVGFGALFACRAIAKSTRIDFHLCGMSQPLRRIFEIMQLHLVVNSHRDLETALVALTGSVEIPLSLTPSRAMAPDCVFERLAG